MATAKKTKTGSKTGEPADASARRAAATRKAAKVGPAAKKAAAKTADSGAMKPIKSGFTKSGLIAHLAEASGVDMKGTRAVMASLEATVLASVHRKGLGEFTLPGLLKVNVLQIPAKKKRTGIDPFTKQERVFAAKPATVRVKARALKKLKDAAL